MYGKRLGCFIFVLIFALPVLAAQPAEAPPWAEHVMSELGCMGGMFGEMEGKVFVDGVTMDNGAKLKAKGFTIKLGAPYRVSVTKTGNDKYEVSVKRMDQPGASEVKKVEIK